jgi:hypothetical protein
LGGILAGLTCKIFQPDIISLGSEFKNKKLLTNLYFVWITQNEGDVKERKGGNKIKRKVYKIFYPFI